MILDRIISVKYLLPDADNSDKEGYVSNLALSNVRINIQPANDQTLAIADGVLGQTFTGFVSQSGLAEGNYITVSGTSDSYLIRGISDWSSPNLIPHYQLLLEKVKE